MSFLHKSVKKDNNNNNYNNNDLLQTHGPYRRHSKQPTSKNMVGHKSLQNRCLHMITRIKETINITPIAASQGSGSVRKMKAFLHQNFEVSS